jgi:cell wall-associated NlpC family hydrolase
MRLRADTSHSPHINPTESQRSACHLRLSALIALWLGLTGAKPTCADGTLTLQLPPSPAAVEARREVAAQARQQASASANALPDRYRTTLSSRGGMTGRGQADTSHAVGRLGQLAMNAGIYRQRSLTAGMLTRVASGTYVAIQREEGEWDGVLMADGSTGWLPAQAVRQFDLEVEATGTQRAPAMGSLPGYSEADDIYPRSNQPFFTGDAQMLLREAYRYIGVPYVWGGNTFHGLDCSGFIKNVFAANGYSLPRLGSDQMAYGVPVPVDQLQAGDRLYFGRRTDRVGVTHTGLYIGNGYFIHSSSSRHGVAISHLSESLFRRIYVCARR